MGTDQEGKSFKADGIRPIESTDLEIVDTFSDDGIRPIAKGSIELISNPDSARHDSDEGESLTPSSTSNDSQLNQSLNTDKDAIVDEKKAKEDSKGKLDGERPFYTSGKKVVDTFVDDGTRPIMKDDYEVVATLNVDGERPITSQQ